MFASKGNKQYTITEAEKADYLRQGYDILDDNGKIIENNGNKKVSYAEYEKAQNKIHQLTADLEALRAGVDLEMKRVSKEPKKTPEEPQA